MNVKSLRAYIKQLGQWGTDHGAPTLGTGSASPVTHWQEELTASGGLLEAGKELPIAFLGPSQQGKSSLINALLGQEILAVGGAIGACTCVITSIHYRENARFRAEIDFIRLKDWRAELRALAEAVEAAPSPDDSPEDIQEWEAGRKAALEKLKAVYRMDSPEGIRDLLLDGELGLPSDIAQAMRHGHPILIEEENARTLRNKVRRYLVGREQHDDGQFWPLIKTVRISGDFKVLAHGVVLVDLPGLNDPNPAREQVTKKYLEEAHYVWLICNSQTGIDKVFTQVLRDTGLFFRLFLHGRLGAFSVIATRIDDTNIRVVLEQMGHDPDNYDGPDGPVIDFRRKEIDRYIRSHLMEIAGEIVAAAADASEDGRREFLQQVRKIPVFSIATTAYLHAIGLNRQYRGLALSAEQTHVPKLLKHLHAITLERSFTAQVEAVRRRLVMLHDQIRRFFLDVIRRDELDNQEAAREWGALRTNASTMIDAATASVRAITSGSDTDLANCSAEFEKRMAGFDQRAIKALDGVFGSWEAVNWRSLQAAVRRNGEWFSRSLQRQFDFNQDIASAYLGLVPFVWEDFFGKELTGIVHQVATRTEDAIKLAAAQVQGAMSMLAHQPPGVSESMEASLKAAAESFALQSGLILNTINDQILRTRQSLAAGMVETARNLMGDAYKRAAWDPGGSGVKRRMLDVLQQHARQHAPVLFVGMRRDLADGVTILMNSIKPPISKLTTHGAGVVDRMKQNLVAQPEVTPETRPRFKDALDKLPAPEAFPMESA